jgi:hypothetical protein
MAGPTAMTVINIQMIFLDRCRNNGRSRVDDFVPLTGSKTRTSNLFDNSKPILDERQCRVRTRR